MTKFNRQRVKVQKQVPTPSRKQEVRNIGDTIVQGLFLTFILIVMAVILFSIVKTNTMETYYEEVEYRQKVGISE